MPRRAVCGRCRSRWPPISACVGRRYLACDGSDIDLDKRTLRVQRGLQRNAQSRVRSQRLEFFDVKTENSRRRSSSASDSLRDSSDTAKRRPSEGCCSVQPGSTKTLCAIAETWPARPGCDESRDKALRGSRWFFPAGVRLHDVRHGVATAMLASGVDTKDRISRTRSLHRGIHCRSYQHVLRGMTKSAQTRIDKALAADPTANETAVVRCIREISRHCPRSSRHSSGGIHRRQSQHMLMWMTKAAIVGDRDGTRVYDAALPKEGLPSH